MGTSQKTRIRETIRTLRSVNGGVTEDELFDALRETADDFEAAKDRYEQLRKQGEVYSYPQGGVVVVKITDEVLA